MPPESHGPGGEHAGPPWDRVQEWFLLEGHRLHVAGVTTITLFGCLLALLRSGMAPLQQHQPLYYVYGGMISGNLTVITVVVAINQVLLSREFYTPKELESQMNGIFDYREDVEREAGRVPPINPSGFLRVLVDNTLQEARTLDELTLSVACGEAQAGIASVVAGLVDHAESVDRALERSDASTFETLSTLLSTNYAEDLYALRRVRAEYAEQLPEPVRESMADLVERLKEIDIARQYFKTVYLQEELATLSRLLFFVGLLSLATVIAGLLVLTASTGPSVSGWPFALLTAAIITAGLFPTALLFAFLIRIATVSRRTAAILPFTTAQDRR